MNNADQQNEMRRGECGRGANVALPPDLRVFLLASALLTLGSLLYSLISRELGVGLPASFAYYYVPGDMFSDFVNFRGKMWLWGTPAFMHQEFMYPAPLVHVFRVLLALPHPTASFAVIICLIVAILGTCFFRILRANGLAVADSLVFVFGTAVFSYPLAYEVQRWNVEILPSLVFSLAVWCLFTGRAAAGASLAGLAGAPKFYPLILLGTLLPARRYRAFALGLGVFVAVSLLSLRALSPSIVAAAKWNEEQVSAFARAYIGTRWALGYDHSVFGLLKVATLHLRLNYLALSHRYVVFMGLLWAGLYFVRIWRLPLANQILVLSVLCVTIPPISYDYTLLNLYPAFAMLCVLVLRQARGEAEVRYSRAYMLLFAMAFTPQSYVVFQGVRFGAQVRGLALLVILALGLAKPLMAPDELRVAKEAMPA